MPVQHNRPDTTPVCVNASESVSVHECGCARVYARVCTRVCLCVCVRLRVHVRGWVGVGGWVGGRVGGRVCMGKKEIESRKYGKN